MSSASERLLYFLDYKGESKYKFYKKTGLSNGFLDKSRNIGSDKCEIISREYRDLNLIWLITGEGNMLTDNKESKEEAVNILHESKLYENKEGRYIKLYPYEASANLKTIFNDNNEEMETIYIPNAPKCDAAIYVRGDSMTPIINSGDIIAYKNINNIENIQYGQIYLVNYQCDDDEYRLAVKYIKKSDKKGYIKLVSHNPHHDPQDIPLSAIKNLALVKISIRQSI